LCLVGFFVGPLVNTPVVALGVGNLVVGYGVVGLLLGALDVGFFVVGVLVVGKRVGVVVVGAFVGAFVVGALVVGLLVNVAPGELTPLGMGSTEVGKVKSGVPCQHASSFPQFRLVGQQAFAHTAGLSGSVLQT